MFAWSNQRGNNRGKKATGVPGIQGDRDLDKLT